MRDVDQLYWDILCEYKDGVNLCGCNTLEEALKRHPKLVELRDGPSDRSSV